MKISYQCSNCGAHEQTLAGIGIPEGMFYLGYRAHGDVVYCPNCVETWKERNAVEYGAPFDEPRDGVRARISTLFGGLTECAKE